MSLTLAGVLAIPLLVVIWFSSRKNFLVVTVFLITFTSTAVIGFGTEKVSLPLFVTFLFLLREFIKVSILGRIQNVRVHEIWIVIFFIMIVVIASLSIPIFYSGELLVKDRFAGITTMYAKSIPLKFRINNLTQTAYLLIGLILALFVSKSIHNRSELIFFLKTYITSCFVLGILGLLHLISFYGLPVYPFNVLNHLGVSGMSNYTILNYLPRFASATLEASVYAMEISPAVGILFWSNYTGQYLYSKNLDRVIISFLMATLILTQSTTVIVAMATLFFIFIFYVSLKGKVKRNFTTLFLIGFLGFFISIPIIVRVFLFKIKSFSGIERLLTISDGWEYFKKFPFLGIGWGTYPTYDLIMNILVGSGILGLFTFLLLFIVIFLGLIKKFDKNDPVDEFLFLTHLTILLIIILVAQLSGFNFYNQFIWVLIGFCIAYINLARFSSITQIK